MPTHCILTLSTELKCRYCESEKVRLLLYQRYYICDDCQKLLWQVEDTKREVVVDKVNQQTNALR